MAIESASTSMTGAEIAAIKSAEDHRHQAGIDLVSKFVTDLSSHPLLLF